MVPLTSLLIPIVLSAVIVFIASSIIHMVLGYHRNDYRGVSQEEAVQAALRPFALTPGDYALPYAGSMDRMKSPEFMERRTKGPVVLLTVLPSGEVSMG